MGNLDAMKQQAQSSIDRNLEQARELQTIGQRVQQGDPDYLKDGETRESKIAELASKLASLKKQQQVLLQQQKELDIDPVALDSEDARSSQDRKSSLKARVDTTENEARSQLRALQPMIQEHHTGWQRLLEQQKKLDANQYALTSRLDEAGRASEMEASMRADFENRIQELVMTLQGMGSYLGQIGIAEPMPSAPKAQVAAAPVRPSAPAGIFGDDDEYEGEPVRLVPTPVPVAAPAVSPTQKSAEVDDFDAFLQEDPDMT